MEEISISFSSDCKIGITMNGFLVKDLEEGLQANYFGVQPGWTVTNIDGLSFTSNPDQITKYIQEFEAKKDSVCVISFIKTRNNMSSIAEKGVEQIELKFATDCKLGLAVEGFIVVDVEEGGQANYFGVEIGWTIIGTNGILNTDNVKRLSKYLKEFELRTFDFLTLTFAKTAPIPKSIDFRRNSDGEGFLDSDPEDDVDEESSSGAKITLKSYLLQEDEKCREDIELKTWQGKERKENSHKNEDSKTKKKKKEQCMESILFSAYVIQKIMMQGKQFFECELCNNIDCHFLY